MCSLAVILLKLQSRKPPSVLETNDCFQVRIARQLFHRSHRLIQLDVSYSPSLDEVEHEPGRPDLQRRRILAHVGIADDEMEPAIFSAVGMGLVPGIENRPVVHRIDAQLRFHKISALRELIPSWNVTGLLCFSPD